MVFLLLLGPQGIPPLSQDLADSPVVLVGVPLVDQGPVSLAEDHEGIHGPTDMVLLPLELTQPRGLTKPEDWVWGWLGWAELRYKESTLLGLRPSFSEDESRSFGKALRDWVRRFPGGRGS